VFRFDPGVVLAAFLLASCAGSVRVSDAGNGVKASPKPKGCAMPFLRAKPPDRPFDELASLHYSGGMNREGDPAQAESSLRERACELGADALVVSREFVPGVAGAQGSPPFMSATAIVYRPAATGDPAASGR